MTASIFNPSLQSNAAESQTQKNVMINLTCCDNRTWWPYFRKYAPSMVPVVPKLQHEPHTDWSEQKCNICLFCIKCGSNHKKTFWHFVQLQWLCKTICI